MNRSDPPLIIALLFIVAMLFISGLFIKLAFSMHPFVGVITFLYIFSRWTRVVTKSYRQAVAQERARDLGFY